MKKDLNKAEQIFNYYGGSHFFMARDERYAYYKTFDISHEQELIWCRKLQLYYFNRIKEFIGNANDQFWVVISRYLDTVKMYSEFGLLDEIMKFIDENKMLIDSYTMLLISKELLDTFEFYENRVVDISPILLVKTTAIDLLNEIISNDIIVDIAYKHIKSNVIEVDSIINSVEQLLMKYK